MEVIVVASIGIVLLPVSVSAIVITLVLKIFVTIEELNN